MCGLCAFIYIYIYIYSVSEYERVEPVEHIGYSKSQKQMLILLESDFEAEIEHIIH